MKGKMDGHMDERKKENEGPTDDKVLFLLPKRWLFKMFKFERNLECYIFSQILMERPIIG